MKLVRIVGISILAMLAASLPACQRGPRPLTVAFLSNNPHEFWTIARRGTEKAAADLEIAVEFYMPANGTAAEQHRIVEDLIAKGVKGIAISPNNAAHQSRVFNSIIPSNVAFLTQDSDLPPGSKRLCYIGTDNVRAGWAVGTLIKEALPDGGKIMIYVGMLDVQNARERRQGVIAALAGLSEDEAKTAWAQTLAEKDRIAGLSDKYEILGAMTDGASQAKCKQNVEDTLSAHPDVNALVGLWAYNPPAMLQAVLAAGKQDKIKLVGFDEDEQTLQGIKAGHIYATVVQNPYLFGYASVRILKFQIETDRLPEANDLKDQPTIRKEGTDYWVKHRVIRRRAAVQAGQLFDEDVEEFHRDLKVKKG